jgi:hypothetical protein
MGRLHPNVLKIRKQKRLGRRAWFKDYGGAIHVPRSVGKSDIPNDAQALFNYRDRGNTPETDAFLDAIFPGVKQTSDRRKFALDRADEEKIVDRLSTDAFCDFVTLKDNKRLQSRLTYIFNRKKTHFFFVEAWYAEGASFVRISKEYVEKDKILFDFGNFNPGIISWREVLPITSLELLLPSRG